MHIILHTHTPHKGQIHIHILKHANTHARTQVAIQNATVLMRKGHRGLFIKRMREHIQNTHLNERKTYLLTLANSKGRYETLVWDNCNSKCQVVDQTDAHQSTCCKAHNQVPIRPLSR